MNPASVSRQNDSALASLEKRTLLWIAARMPRAVNSDHLTALAAVGTVAAGAGFSLGPASVAGVALIAGGLAVNWFGDSLDGTLARVRGQQRPRYGYYIDHVLDSAGMLLLFGGMAFGGYLTPVVALATLVAYYFLSIEVYLATHALGTFRMSYWRVGPTELRIVLVAAALLVLIVHPHVVWFGRALRPFDIGAVIGAAGLLVTTLRSAVENTIALYRAEPLP